MSLEEIKTKMKTLEEKEKNSTGASAAQATERAEVSSNLPLEIAKPMDLTVPKPQNEELQGPPEPPLSVEEKGGIDSRLGKTPWGCSSAVPSQQENREEALFQTQQTQASPAPIWTNDILKETRDSTLRRDVEEESLGRQFPSKNVERIAPDPDKPENSTWASAAQTTERAEASSNLPLEIVKFMDLNAPKPQYEELQGPPDPPLLAGEAGGTDSGLGKTSGGCSGTVPSQQENREEAFFQTQQTQASSAPIWTKDTLKETRDSTLRIDGEEESLGPHLLGKKVERIGPALGEPEGTDDMLQGGDLLRRAQPGLDRPSSQKEGSKGRKYLEPPYRKELDFLSKGRDRSPRDKEKGNRDWDLEENPSQEIPVQDKRKQAEWKAKRAELLAAARMPVKADWILSEGEGVSQGRDVETEPTGTEPTETGIPLMDCAPEEGMEKVAEREKERVQTYVNFSLYGNSPFRDPGGATLIPAWEEGVESERCASDSESREPDESGSEELQPKPKIPKIAYPSPPVERKHLDALPACRSVFPARQRKAVQLEVWERQRRYPPEKVTEWIVETPYVPEDMVKLWAYMVCHLTLEPVEVFNRLPKVGRSEVFKVLTKSKENLLKILKGFQTPEEQTKEVGKAYTYTMLATERILSMDKSRKGEIVYPDWTEEKNFLRMLQAVTRAWRSQETDESPKPWMGRHQEPQFTAVIQDTDYKMSESAFLDWLQDIIDAIRNRIKLMKQMGQEKDRTTVKITREPTDGKITSAKSDEVRDADPVMSKTDAMESREGKASAADVARGARKKKKGISIAAEGSGATRRLWPAEDTSEEEENYGSGRRTPRRALYARRGIVAYQSSPETGEGLVCGAESSSSLVGGRETRDLVDRKERGGKLWAERIEEGERMDYDQNLTDIFTSSGEEAGETEGDSELAKRIPSSEEEKKTDENKQEDGSAELLRWQEDRVLIEAATEVERRDRGAANVELGGRSVQKVIDSVRVSPDAGQLPLKTDGMGDEGGFRGRTGLSAWYEPPKEQSGVRTFEDKERRGPGTRAGRSGVDPVTPRSGGASSHVKGVEPPTLGSKVTEREMSARLSTGRGTRTPSATGPVPVEKGRRERKGKMGSVIPITSEGTSGDQGRAERPPKEKMFPETRAETESNAARGDGRPETPGPQIPRPGVRSYATAAAAGTTGGTGKPTGSRGFAFNVEAENVEDANFLDRFYTSLPMNTEPKQRYVIRLRYKGADEEKLDRDYIVQGVIVDLLGFPLDQVLAVITPIGLREIDICLVNEGAYHLFWDACRTARKSDQNFLTDFDIIPLFRGEIKVLTVSFRTTNVPAQDVSVWLRRHCKVLLEPEKRRDRRDVWTGEYRAIVGLHKNPMTGQIRHVPKYFFMGADRAMVRYAGQPPACFQCGSFSHRRRDCQTPLCSRCGVTGHATEICRRPVTCNLCLQEGHPYAWCPKAHWNAEDPERFELLMMNEAEKRFSQLQNQGGWREQLEKERWQREEWRKEKEQQRERGGKQNTRDPRMQPSRMASEEGGGAEGGLPRDALEADSWQRVSDKKKRRQKGGQGGGENAGQWSNEKLLKENQYYRLLNLQEEAEMDTGLEGREKETEDMEVECPPRERSTPRPSPGKQARMESKRKTQEKGGKGKTNRNKKAGWFTTVQTLKELQSCSYSELAKMLGQAQREIELYNLELRDRQRELAAHPDASSMDRVLSIKGDILDLETHIKAITHQLEFNEMHSSAVATWRMEEEERRLISGKDSQSNAFEGTPSSLFPVEGAAPRDPAGREGEPMEVGRPVDEGEEAGQSTEWEEAREDLEDSEARARPSPDMRQIGEFSLIDCDGGGGVTRLGTRGRGRFANPEVGSGSFFPPSPPPVPRNQESEALDLSKSTPPSSETEGVVIREAQPQDGSGETARTRADKRQEDTDVASPVG